MRERCYYAAFMAGTRVGSLQEGISRVLERSQHGKEKSQEKTHLKNLPPPPKYHSQLTDHPFGDQFLEAERTHLKSHSDLKSWREVPVPYNKQVLDCKWVYVYKVDKDGSLLKCKARLVVRGDQQRNVESDTYAATLASKSFRAIMATAARRDHELTQYDVTNAFVNASLPDTDEIYMKQPPGYRYGGIVLRIQKALYGLKQSPKLWQKRLSEAMIKCGFRPSPHEACCFIKDDDVILFSYVDDLVFSYPKSKKSIVEEAVALLETQFKLTGGKDLQWFLGIEVIRDRPNKTIWLSQAAYMDKLMTHLRSDLARKKAPTTPIREEEHLPNTEHASPQSIHRYQRKMGGALYPAIITRPDIAFAASRLGRFASNPNAEHHEALDRLIHYLYGTRFHALQIGGSISASDSTPGAARLRARIEASDMLAISDASFADNSVDRKSSQGLIISLYGGIVYWRATKQDTVTTSTTEAELLALSHAAKEGLFMQRLIRELKLATVASPLRLQCDNQQTVGLVMKDDTKLATKLRHVDIHNHWLRQEAKNGMILVEHVYTDEMLADGLTKALKPGKFTEFRQHIGVVDITDLINPPSPTKPDRELVDEMEDLLI